MPLLNPSLKANCEKFDSELGELRTPGGSADSCVSSVKCHGVLQGHRKIDKLIIPIHTKGDRNEWNRSEWKSEWKNPTCEAISPVRKIHFDNNEK